MASAPQPNHEDVSDEESILDGIRYPSFVKGANVRRIPQLEIRDDDIWLVTYPKTGTHWMKTIIYQLYNHNTPEGRGEKPPPFQNEYIPFVEFVDFKTGEPEIDKFMKIPTNKRRIISTHLQPHWLSKQYADKKPKTIHIMRNPKDTAVSFFHFLRDVSLMKTRHNWDTYLEGFLSGDIPFGSYADFVNLWYDVSKKANVLNLLYEDLKKDLKGGVEVIAKYLEVDLSEAEVTTIAERCTFDAMKNEREAKTPKIASVVFRKGVTGGWKNAFTESQSEKFDKFFAKKWEHLDFKFQYE
ncbi:sulfotransferase 6B1-like isoform X1 [Ptychodera flava]|uniref:sulfotransferase 6B1-like isoform X1 n=1 Tax=Ptychodera flava TaxID=63121 RepID=UPI003969FA76